jgi:hypothetical protein
VSRGTSLRIWIGVSSARAATISAINILDDSGCDHFARSAPCGEAVEDDEVVLVL